jgi:predicted DNA-binding protein (UPF0251 family)/predicted Fe-Mo cluster-binding NifX family protein
MPRPLKCRKVNNAPDITYFKPRGVPLRELAEVYLSLDGFEAIRLADHEGLSHEKAAQQMHVSRQTFGRILAAARNTVAKALVGGLALRIHGGHYHLLDGAVKAGDNSDDGAAAVEPDVNYTQKERKMKMIAITSEGPTLDDLVDPRFGRAAGFILVDPETLAFDYVENGAAQVRAQGAGIQAAETVANAGATVVLTGYVGPKAFQALAAAGIRIAQDLDNMRVREAIDRFNSGKIQWSDLSDAKGPKA